MVSDYWIVNVFGDGIWLQDSRGLQKGFLGYVKNAHCYIKSSEC